MVLLNLRQHLYLSVAVPLALGMIVCVVAALVPLYSSIHSWNDQTSATITQMSLAASTTRLSKLNENLQVIYDQLAHDLRVARNNTYAAVEGAQAISAAGYPKSYYAQLQSTTMGGNPDPILYPTDVPVHEDTAFSLTAFPAASLCFVNPNNFALNDDAAFQAQPHVQTTSLTDGLHRALYKANWAPLPAVSTVGASGPLYSKIMLGFETGLFRRYPHTAVPRDYVDGNVPAATLYCTGSEASYGPGYDPRCRPWYTQSVTAAKAGLLREGDIVFSPPYVDALSKATTISASTPLFDRQGGQPGSSGQGTVFGALNIDFNMNFVDASVRGATVSEQGYMFLMDKAGNVISHPRWDRAALPTVRVEAIEPAFAFSDLWAALTAAAGAEAYAQSSPFRVGGFTAGISTNPSIPSAYLLSVSNDAGDSWYVGVTTNPTTGYVLVMMLPRSDLTAADDRALSDLKGQLDPGTVGLVVVLVALLVGILVGTHYISRYYSRAIKDAATILEQATKPNVQVQLAMREPVCYELNLLFKQFEPMFVAIRFGNDSFYEGNLDKALSDYNMAEALMTKQQNDRGLAKVYNNKGNVYLKLGNFAQAEANYTRSISMGQKLLAECVQQLAQTNQKLEAAIEKSGGIELGAMGGGGGGGRKIHVGGAGRNDDAKEDDASLKLDPNSEAGLMAAKRKLQSQRIQLMIQIGKRQSNLGVLLRQQGKTQASYSMLQSALGSHQAADDDVGMARVGSNLAQAYIDDGMLDEAQATIQSTYAKLSQQSEEHAPDPLSLQYATMTLGLLCQKQRKFTDAAGWLQYTLQLQEQHSVGGVVDSAVQTTCFVTLEAVFKALNNPVMSKKYRGLHNRHILSKNVLFALDCSGSMAGGSIKRCRNSITDILMNHIEPEDRVGLISFNSKTKMIFALTEKGYEPAVMKHMEAKIENETFPNGQTSFWDALYEGISELARVRDLAVRSGNPRELARPSWLIALTDGEDNASQRTVAHVNRHLAANPVAVIIITVGQSYDKNAVKSIINLQALKDAKKSAHHIQIESDAISTAFENVAKLITAQLNVETM